MQGFLFSCPPGAGQRRPLTPGPFVVTCEALPSGRRVCWPLSAGRPGPAGGFRVVILHEDLATGLRARKVGGLLAEALGAKGRVEPELWRWDVLQDPVLQRRAAREAARADLLILSVHRHLPAVPTDALLDAWLAAKAHRASHLVALVDGAGAQGSATAWLCELAWRRGLDCLEHLIEGGGKDSSKMHTDGRIDLGWAIQNVTSALGRPFWHQKGWSLHCGSGL
jgi:hypothetical protein